VTYVDGRVQSPLIYFTVQHNQKGPTIMITKPDGYDLPEGTKEGDTFDELVTLKVGADGYLTPVAIAGVEIPEKEEEAEEPEEEMSMGKAIMEGI
jgi:hypothetical protein